MFRVGPRSGERPSARAALSPDSTVPSDASRAHSFVSSRSTLSSKAAAGAAALFLFASPAALADGLVLQNGTNSAPGKYEQPFYDPRPVVDVELDSSADLSTESARVSATKQVGMKGCKTITGAPCVGASEITMQ